MEENEAWICPECEEKVKGDKLDHFVKYHPKFKAKPEWWIRFLRENRK